MYVCIFPFFKFFYHRTGASDTYFFVFFIYSTDVYLQIDYTYETERRHELKMHRLKPLLCYVSGNQDEVNGRRGTMAGGLRRDNMSQQGSRRKHPRYVFFLLYIYYTIEY